MSFSTYTVEEAIKEYLLFRGFTTTLKCLDAELKTDKDKGLAVENLVQQLFSFIASFDLEGLVAFWDQLNRRFFSKLGPEFTFNAKKLEISLRRYYLVHCVENMRQDKVVHFFEVLATENQAPEWRDWWILPFTKSPENHPIFESFFGKSWFESLNISLFNFLSSVLHSVPLPFLLQIQKRKSINVSETYLEGGVVDLKPANISEELPEVQLVTPAKATAASTAETPLETLSDSVPAPSIPEKAFELGQDVAVYREHRTAVQLCLISPRQLSASLDSNNTLEVWSCNPSHVVKKLSITFPPEDCVTCMAWIHPSDRSLALGHASGRILVLDVHGIAPHQTVVVDDARDIKAIDCDAAGKLLVCTAVEKNADTGRGIVAFVDPAALRTVAREPLCADGVQLQAVRFNRAATLVVAGDTDGRILVISVAKCEVVLAWNAHHGAVYDVRFSQDEASVLTYGADGLVLRVGLERHDRSVIQLDSRIDIPAYAAQLPGLRRLCVDETDSYALMVQLSPESGGLSTAAIFRLRFCEKPSGDVFPLVVCTTQSTITCVDWCPSASVCVCASSDGLVHSYPLMCLPQSPVQG